MPMILSTGWTQHIVVVSNTTHYMLDRTPFGVQKFPPLNATSFKAILENFFFTEISRIAAHPHSTVVAFFFS